MNALVFNQEFSDLDLSWEAMAIRTGWLLSERVYAFGAAATHIQFDRFWHRKGLSTETKLRLMEKSEAFQQSGLNTEELLTLIKGLRKKQRHNRQAIVGRKQIEGTIDEIYKQYVEEVRQKMVRYGMMQLEPFSDREDFVLWFTTKDYGECDDPCPLSSVLSWETAENSYPSADVAVMYDKLGKDIENDMPLMPLVRFPNLNSLGPDQLLSVKAALTDVVSDLNNALSFMPETGYLTGEWDRGHLPAITDRLQQVVDAHKELQWSKIMQGGLELQVSVGSIPADRLYALMKKHRCIPSDTSEVLEERVKKGEFCPSIPMLVLQDPRTQLPLNHLTIEETATHRRKTLDLD